MWRRGKSKIATLGAVVTMSTCAGLTGCANQPQVSADAGPTTVCGTVLADSAAAPVVYDATHHLPTINGLTVGDVLMFRVARGCNQGAHVRWVPATAAQLVKAAYAADGQMAAVVLKPSSAHAAFQLFATRNGQIVASATVKLAS